MLENLLESLSGLLLAVIVWRFLKIGARDLIRKQPGWRYIFGGTILILVAQLFDVTDNFPSLNGLMLVGDSDIEGLIENGGRFGGYLLLAVGFWKWLPVLEEREILLVDLDCKKRSLLAAAEDLISQEELARLITDAANDAIFTIDGQGVITFCNPAAGKMFEYDSQEILGKKLHELLLPVRYHADYQRGFAAFVEDAGSCAVGKIIEVDLLKKSGREFPVEVSVSPLRYGYDWQALGILRDITERRESVREKLEMTRRLRQAHKMEAIGTLAGGIAHDFNNILSAIIGYGEMVLDELPPGPEREKQEQVVMAGRRAKGLVRQILAFSRVGPQERGPLLMQYVVKEALKLLRATIPSTIEIVAEIDAGCGPVLADPGQIHQLMMNLCTNAYQAMRETGGVLTVSLANAKLGAAEAAARINLRPGWHVVLEVRDTGPGMDSAVRDRIFEPYFTTKGQGEGTGLGLAVVHGIVLGMGGEIVVDSSPGQGATFRIYLPQTEAALEEGPVSTETAIPRGTEQVMVVDDDKIIVLMVSSMLCHLGYHVTPIGDSREALGRFREAPESFDLLLTDMTMPGMTGAELATEVLRIRPGLPVILCTGFSELIDRDAAKALGIKEFMLKPVEKADLARVVRQVLDGASANF
ncbi:MAG: response regulator [Desulfobulbaceae bacterium]|nr:response regulator [Desulfobulbaceae bacterium]